jgi:hypothetical protein
MMDAELEPKIHKAGEQESKEGKPSNLQLSRHPPLESNAEANANKTDI